MQANELNVTQVKKGIAITVSFVVLRLIAAKLWNLWFGMKYELSIPFLSFLSGVFLVMSVGLIYFGFTKWLGVDLKAWWFKRGQIGRDIVWAVVALIVMGAVVIGGAIVVWGFGVMPSMPKASQENVSLAQLPINLVLGWLFGLAIAAFQEESLFRGFWQRVASRRYGAWKGNLFQAALFSAAHLGLEPLGSVGTVTAMLLLRFGFGVLFGWLKIKRGSLLTAGIVHGFVG